MSDTEEQEQEHIAFEFDFTGITPWGGEAEVLPAGEGYVLDVHSCTQDTAKKSGNQMLKFRFVVAEEQLNPEYAALAGRSVWNNYVLTQKAMSRLANLCVAVKAPLSGFDSDNYVGRRIIADVIHSQSEADVLPDGTKREARTFANIINERPYETAAAAKTETKTVKPPPVAGIVKPATAAKPNNGAPAIQVRRT